MLSEQEYKKLTDPESIAMVGVTTRQGKGSNNPLEVLLEWGYQGKIYPINPKGGTILGHRAYTSLMDVPEVPDLAVICAPRDAVPELFEQCGKKNVQVVIIIAQGFLDGDETGRLMQEELFQTAEKYGMRVLGPNTLGVTNNFNGFCTSFIRFMNRTAETGILCQSGLFVNGAVEINNGIGVLIDTGNTTDIEFSDVLGHLARDSRLKVISMHMESLRNGQKFIQAARDAVKLKPVIIYKTGTSPYGSRVASSHTGNLSGEDRVFEAAFQQCGLFRVKDVEEMYDLNKIFCTFDGIKGNKVGVISISGAGAVIAVDACAKYGLEVAPVSEDMLDQLSEMFPEWARCSNPMDIWPAAIVHGYKNVFRRIMEAFMEDPQIDSVICVTGAFIDEEGDFLDITGDIREIAAKNPGKPVAAYTYGPRSQDYASKLEKDQNVVYFNSVERAARAISALYKYYQEIKKKEHLPVSLPVNAGQTEVEKIIAPKNEGELSQEDAFKILEAYGFAVARWETAGNIDEAISLAENIGYPISMKILSPDITHKSDVGGVRVNIVNAHELQQEFTDMYQEIRCKQPQARIDGVILQEYIDGGTELLLGSKRDPQFGPVIIFGSGGVYTEILDDISLRIPPLGRDEIMEMIEETKVNKILAGARGTSAVDKEMLINCVTILSQLVQANPSISEMDINPMIANENRIAALDVRITLRQA